jgi:hypothetical protein
MPTAWALIVLQRRSSEVNLVRGPVNPSLCGWLDGAQRRPQCAEPPDQLLANSVNHARCTDRLNPPPDVRRVEEVGRVLAACRCGKWDI